MKKTIILLSFILFTFSLAACEDDDDGCYCDFELSEAKICVKSTFSGDDCPACSTCEASGGKVVSSCGGTKINSFSSDNPDGDCTANGTCYALNEAGEAACESMKEGLGGK